MSSKFDVKMTIPESLKSWGLHQHRSVYQPHFIHFITHSVLTCQNGHCLTWSLQTHGYGLVLSTVCAMFSMCGFHDHLYIYMDVFVYWCTTHWIHYSCNANGLAPFDFFLLLFWHRKWHPYVSGVSVYTLHLL